jgi:hypothetical protein
MRTTLKPFASGLAVISTALLAALPARAMDKFEIQVYQGEHNDPVGRTF